MSDVYQKRRNAWKEELLSGKYNQGKGQMFWRDSEEGDKPDTYCCVGVGCTYFSQATGIGRWEGVQANNAFYIGTRGYPGYDSSFALMPVEVIKWYGLHHLDDALWRVIRRDIQSLLYNCNDALRMNFAQIAEVIG